MTTIDGQDVPFTATPLRSIPAFTLRELALGGVRCGLDVSAVLYCWNELGSADPFWTNVAAWSVGASTPVRVSGQ